MKKTILSLGIIVALASPTLFGLKAHVNNRGFEIDTSLSRKPDGYVKADRVSYRTKEDFTSSALRAGAVEASCMILGNFFVPGVGAIGGAIAGALFNTAWTACSDKEANYTAQVSSTLGTALMAGLAIYSSSKNSSGN